MEKYENTAVRIRKLLERGGSVNLDSLFSGVKAWQEKKKENTANQKEFKKSLENFQEAERLSGGLDEEIQKEFQELGRNYREEASLLEEEWEMLEAERGGMQNEIQKKLEELEQARKKLETAASGKYGEHFREALAVCDRSIQSYRELMALIEAEAGECQGDAAAARANLQKENVLLTELQIRESAISMLVSITKEQRAAVSYYTGSGYKQTNPYLRRQAPRPDDKVLDQIQALHSLLSEQQTKRPVTVYRGVSHDTPMISGSKRGLNTYSDEELYGKLLVDGAFVSTSLREDSAFSGTMLVLDLPVGTRGAYVGDISTLQHVEREFLMDKDQAFRVTRVERRNGKRYIYAKSLRK